MRRAGLPVTPFAPVKSLAELHTAVAEVGLPAVLKTADSGYDGKGQSMIHAADEAVDAWASIDGQPAVLEGFVDYQRECSVLVARSPAGEIAVQGPIANDHANHILDVSMFPLTALETHALAAQEIARQVAIALDLVGVACVEFFLTRDGRVTGSRRRDRLDGPAPPRAVAGPSPFS